MIKKDNINYIFYLKMLFLKMYYKNTFSANPVMLTLDLSLTVLKSQVTYM